MDKSKKPILKGKVTKKVKNLNLKLYDPTHEKPILKGFGEKPGAQTKKKITQGGIINTALALDLSRNSIVHSNAGASENYDLFRNTGRIRGSESMRRGSKEEVSMNMASPRNDESSMKSGFSRKKHLKSGNKPSSSASMKARHNGLTVSKIIKINRNPHEPPSRRPTLDASRNSSSLEVVNTSNASRGFENVRGSLGVINFEKLNSNSIVHAAQRFSE